MQHQDLNHHIRYDAFYHFLTAPLAIVGFFISLFAFWQSPAEQVALRAMVVLLFLLVLFLAAMVRLYSLKVQDRAIRAEENLRHYILTGKPLDARLRLSQTIALRFASDAEMPALANEAVEKGYDAKKIKQSIREWKADHHRV